MSVTPYLKNTIAGLILIACLATNAVAQDFFEDFNAAGYLPTTAGTSDMNMPSGAWKRDGAIQTLDDILIFDGSGAAVEIPISTSGFITTPPLNNVASISFYYTAIDEFGADGFIFDVLGSSDGGATFDLVISADVTTKTKGLIEFTHTFATSFTGLIKIQSKPAGDRNGVIDNFSAELTSSFDENFNTGLPPSTGTTDITLTSGTWKRQGIQSDESGSSTRLGSTDAVMFFTGTDNYLQSPSLTGVSFFQFWFRAAAKGGTGFVVDVLGSSDGGTTFDLQLGSQVGSFDTNYKRFTHTFTTPYSGPIKIQINANGDQNGFIDDFIAGAGGAAEPEADPIDKDFFEDFNSGVSMPTTAGTTDIILPSGTWQRNNAVREANDGLIVGGTGYGINLPASTSGSITSPKLFNVNAISFWYTPAAVGGADGFIFDVLGSSDGGTTFDITISADVTLKANSVIQLEEYTHQFAEPYTGPIKIQAKSSGDQNGVIDSFTADFTVDFEENFDTGMPPSTQSSLTLTSGTWLAQNVQSDEGSSYDRNNSGDDALMFSGGGNYLQSPSLTDVGFIQFWYRWTSGGADGFVFDVLGSSDSGTTFDITIASQVTAPSNDPNYKRFYHEFGSAYSGPIKIQFNGIGDAPGAIDDFIAGAGAAAVEDISFIIPNESTEVKFGETLNINWDNAAYTGTDLFTIQYREVGTQTWTAIANNVAASTLVTGTGNEMDFDWTVPDLGTKIDFQAEIRVSNNTLTKEAISSAFRVFYASSVSITSPTGTEQLKFRETLDIIWENGDLGSNDVFSIFYSVDGGNYTGITGTIFHSSLTNEGNQSTYTWTLPDLGADSASQIAVRVLNNTRTVSDTSETFRLYYEPSVTILAPTGTEQLKFRETLDITWENGDIGPNDIFSIYYSVDGGNYTGITGTIFHSSLTNEGNQSTYTWTLPDLGADSASQIAVRVLNNTRTVSDTSETFRLYYEPSVTILAPTGTEQLKFRETLNITWENGDIGPNDIFSIYYSVDEGNYTGITGSIFHSSLTNEGNQSTYTWTLPDLGADSASQIAVRVLNNTRTVSDTSETFRLYYEPSVTILAPTGTEQLKFSETLNITWENGDIGPNDIFSIFYSVDGGNYTGITGTIFHSSLTNEGNQSTYTWTLPDLGADSASQIAVRVLNNTRTVSDTSETFRLYYEPSVTITSPQGGRFFLPGTQTSITWENGDIGPNDIFSLFYSVNGGSFTGITGTTFHSQFTNEGKTSSYNWTVPQNISTNVKVRVLNNTRSVSDTTLSFTICQECPAIYLYAPNGGEIFGVGNQTEIGWSVGSTWEPTDEIRIDLSTDGGETYLTEPILESAYSEITDNTFSWTVPDLVTTQGLIKITNVTQNAKDSSDAVFTISRPPARPTDLVAIENANGGLNFMWTDNADNETAYLLEYSDDRSTWLNWSGNLSANSTTYTSGGLGNNGYWWRVRVSAPSLESFSESIYASNFSAPGYALNFDGTDDAIALLDSTAFDFGTGDFTMEAWIKPTSFTASRIIVSDYNGTNAGSMGFYVSNSGQLVAFLSSNVAQLVSPTQTIIAQQWSHVALVKKGDSAFLYHNAQRVAQVNGMENIVSNSNVNMHIGKQPSGTSFPFIGDIDEVKFWDVARNAEDLTISRLTELTGIEEGLVAYYRFDHKSGTILADQTPNQLNGTWTEKSGANTTPRWVGSGAGLSENPIILLQSPNGGETVFAGANYQVRWTAINVPASDQIEIRLSVNGGESYTKLTEGTAGSFNGVYQWPVGDTLLTTSARIQIANITREFTDQSEANFSIEELAIGVTVVSPNGGEFWEVGTQQVISWTPVGFDPSDAIEIRLSKNGGETYSVLSSANNSSYGNNQYALNVPDSISKTSTIIVANTTKNVSDVSDEPFEIGKIDRTISITSPNGGESWTGETTQAITWESSNVATTEQISIQLSTDNGATYTTLTSGFVSAFEGNTFNWTVFNIPTNQARIAIVLTSRTGVADTSEAVFTILKAPDTTPAIFTSINSGVIIGDAFEMSLTMNEPTTIYFLALADGNSIPNATQIETAAKGEATLEGQAAIGTFEYTTQNEPLLISGTGTFVRNQRYDLYLSALDTAGNLSPANGRANVIAQLTPLERDSVTLNTIYISTNGENWANTAENWNTLALSARPEVSIAQGRVTGLDLSGKNIEGGFSQAVLSLDSLQTLNLSTNKIDFIPTMTSLRALETLDVSNNELDFGDLLPNASLLTVGAQYSPQALLSARDSVALAKGSTYNIQVPVSGVGNVYTWKVDNYNTYERVFNNVTGIEGSFIQVTNIDFNNMGTYYLEVTNPALPALTLLSGRVQIWATATLEINVTANNVPLEAGAAYALRNRGPGLPYDSIPKINGIQNPNGLAFTNGKAVFENLLLGEYLIAIRADPTKYLPTYYTNTYLWEEADKLDFKDNLTQSMSMFVLPPPLGPGDGDGDISGTIESDFAEEGEDGGRIDARRKVKQAGCSMRRFVRSGRMLQDEWELIAYVESDDEGRFQFDYIPAGTYRFNIEYPGIPMDPESFVEFVIGEGGDNAFVLEATITEDGISVTRINSLGFTQLELDQFKVYPNPSTDRVFISSGSVEGGLYVNLVSVSGSEVGRFEFKESGLPLEIDLRNVQNGIYFLNVLDPNDSTKKITYKIVVRH